MEARLERLYNESLEELQSIGFDMLDETRYGKIDVSFSKRKTKRYGCCKQENPDKSTAYRVNRRLYFRKFNNHHIEISKWLMDLTDDIVKNTIIHELIHCIPDCNDHGKEFKKIAKLINDKLGYNISRVGNKKEDYVKSNVADKFDDDIEYKYEIICDKCGQKYFRQRIAKNFTKKYLCGICKGRFRVIILK